jgi:low affinity Fe/Cu permease
MKSTGTFGKFAKIAARFTGRPVCFGMATGAVVVWAATGPLFHYSDTWQLVINTSTTIVTFLMVFLIQNTQNSDTAALQIKLDELIRVTKDARCELLDIEELDEKQLETLRAEFRKVARETRVDAA